MQDTEACQDDRTECQQQKGIIALHFIQNGFGHPYLRTRGAGPSAPSPRNSNKGKDRAPPAQRGALARIPNGSSWQSRTMDGNLPNLPRMPQDSFEQHYGDPSRQEIEALRQTPKCSASNSTSNVRSDHPQHAVRVRVTTHVMFLQNFP